MKTRSFSQFPMRPRGRRAPQRAFMMMEALVYIGVSSLLLGIGMAAMYHCIDASVALRRNVDDITTALHIGERWRADMRGATGPVRLENYSLEQILHLAGGSHEIIYRFADSAAFRRVDSGPWVQLPAKLHSSVVEPDQRSKLTAWKWELELETRAKGGKIRPLFTFLAVPGQSQTP